MPGVDDFSIGLIALETRQISRGQLVQAVSVWLADLDLASDSRPPRDLGTVLRDLGYVGDGALAAARVLAPARGYQAGAGIDPSDRDALLAISPPEWLRDALIALPVRRRAGAGYEPLGREERYRLGTQIGRGGLGRVVEGTDRELRREVAIKLTPASGSGEAAERFVREARLAARLDHPNIVPVYDLGEMSGPEGERELFLCMKRVKGRDLRDLTKQIGRSEEEAARWTRARLLRVFQDVCLGMAYAHAQGVIHRDLKPANVMIGEFGETYIVDWGLAKVLGSAEEEPTGAATPVEAAPGSSQLTLAGSVMGTPAYMSPEQAQGRLSDVDARSDLYALGAILWTLVVGRPPIEARTWEEELEMARDARVRRPSAAVADGRGQGPFAEPVPPEIDAIVARAMAAHREDRHASAMELHHDVQLFLEGIRERERMEKEALRREAEGRKRFARYRALGAEIAAREADLQTLAGGIRSWQPVEDKRPLWDAEAAIARLRDERIAEFSRAQSEFEEALSALPSHEGARDGICELVVERFIEAERAGDRDEMLRQRHALESRDASGRHRARLDAPGLLVLRAHAFTCGCLTRRMPLGWAAEFGEDARVAWRDGAPRPALRVEDADLPVPELRVAPAGATWGHAEDCPRREVKGVEVWIERYEERGKRLRLSGRRQLGVTPLAPVELAQGSYLCTLSSPEFGDVRLPVRIDRGGLWKQDLNLYPPSDVPAGFVCVPGGPFLAGGAQGRRDSLEERATRDLFVARAPVTCGEYLAFLNDLASRDRLEEARARQPREGPRRFLREVDGLFAPSPDTCQSSPDLPAAGLSWFDAMAYAAWRSARDGAVFRLLHEFEYEKAARGVDGRMYPWGDSYDGTFSNTNASHADGARLLPSGRFPADASPYGILDLAGNSETWLLNAASAPLRQYMCLRGGAWLKSPVWATVANRQGDVPTYVRPEFGIRLCVAPWKWPV